MKIEDFPKFFPGTLVPSFKYAVAFALTLFGLFSLYFSVLVAFLPRPYKNLIDGTTVASVAMEFYLAIVLSLIFSRVTWLAFYFFLMGKVLRLKGRVLDKRKLVSLWEVQFVRFFGKNELGYVFFSVLFFSSVFMLGFFLGGVFCVVATILLIPIRRFYLVVRRELAKLSDSSADQFVKASKNLATYCLLIGLAFLGVVKNEKKQRDVVEVQINGEIERRSIAFRTSNGLILGPAATGPLYYSVKSGSYTFIPFEEVGRIEPVSP